MVQTMIRQSLVLLYFCASLLFASDSTAQKLTVYFFGSSSCNECGEVKEFILKPLLERYPEKLNIEFHDFDNEASFQLMNEMEDAFNITKPLPQELFLPDTFLIGYEAILESSEELIEEYLAHPERWQKAPVKEAVVDSTQFEKALKKRIKGFTFAGILIAGLIDGVNPCAIATMIFLISFLATQKRKRHEVLIIGLSFTSAVFLTYLLLGIGAFRALTSLDQYFWISEGIRWIAVGLAAVLGCISFVDAFSFKKTGKTDTITLQLPKALKIRIHKIISGNLSGTQLVTGAIATGFLVTLLEAVCTGQVYLPTIVLMTKSSGFQLTGWIYLIFYNFLFVLPLLVIMILAYFGLQWKDLAKATQKHLVLLKITFGILLIGLAAFLGLAG